MSFLARALQVFSGFGQMPGPIREARRDVRRAENRYAFKYALYEDYASISPQGMSDHDNLRRRESVENMHAGAERAYKELELARARLDGLIASHASSRAHAPSR